MAKSVFYLLFVALTPLVAATAALNGAPDDEHFQGLDTDREPAVFTTETRKSGFTYLDSMHVKSLSHVSVGEAFAMDIHMNSYIEMEVEVMDVPSGGKSVDMTIERIKMAVEEFGLPGQETSFVCDSQDTMPPAECAALGLENIIGEPSHFVVDDEGNIAEDNNALVVSQQVSPSEHLEQTSRLLQLIASHPVAPGESWSANADYGDMGSFEGTATLLGYKDFEGSDCAAMRVVGKMHMNSQFLQDQMEAVLGGSAVPHGLSISDAPVSIRILWDDEMRLTRYAVMEMAYTMSMDDPNGGLEKIELSAETVTFMNSQVEDEKQ